MSATFADAGLGESNLEDYVRRISSFPVYDAAEERRLFGLARDGDESALEALISAHLRFVVDLAVARRGWGVSLVKLIEAGNGGLLEAARRFEPEGDRRFLQYAVGWIRQEMRSVLEVA